jgi:very-short-patch-repair endonuclease
VVTQETLSNRKSRQQHRTHAREMRRDCTDRERKFWWEVRDRRLKGFKSKRQFLIGPYIVDFVCLDAGLVVELDGGQHADRMAYDKTRDAYLKARGYRVLRFWNTEFVNNKDGVLEALLCQLESPPHPNPLRHPEERG